MARRQFRGRHKTNRYRRERWFFIMGVSCCQKSKSENRAFQKNHFKKSQHQHNAQGEVLTKDDAQQQEAEVIIEDEKRVDVESELLGKHSGSQPTLLRRRSRGKIAMIIEH